MPSSLELYIRKRSYFIRHLEWNATRKQSTIKYSPEIDYNRDKIVVRVMRCSQCECDSIKVREITNLCLESRSFCLSCLLYEIKIDHKFMAEKVVHKVQKQNAKCVQKWIKRYTNMFNTYNGSIQSKMTDKLSYKWLLSFSVILNDLWIINVQWMMFRFVVSHTFTLCAAPVLLSPLLLLCNSNLRYLFIYFTLFVVVVDVVFFSPFSFLQQITWDFRWLLLDFKTLSPRLDQHRMREKTKQEVEFLFNDNRCSFACYMDRSFDSIDR